MKLIYTILFSLLLVYDVAGQFNNGRQATVGIKKFFTHESKSNQFAQTAGNNFRIMAGTCPPNIGFEEGTLVNWQCDTGHTEVSNKNEIIVSPSPSIADRHTLYARTAASDVDPYGLFPVNPPDGSGYALRLGNDIKGAQAERITYRLTVPANSPDFSFTYRYAVVFQDPGHVADEQPRFIARMLDLATNTYLPCASNEYIATAALPGFQTSSVDPSVKYKNWSSAFINLGAYSGKTLQLEFITADCTQGGHWGYAYVDVGDCDATAGAEYQCKINTATFTGPPGFQEYYWYDDNFGTMLGTGENLVLNPTPVIHNIHVVVVPFNGFGCSDTLHAEIYPILPIANAGPDSVVCPDKPITIGTKPDNRFTYAWGPPDYLSDTSVGMPVSTPPKPASYVVTVTSIESGCEAKDTVNLTMFQPIAVAVSPDQTICEGQSVAIQASGTAVLYAWSPSGGLNRSNIANPVAYPSVTTTYKVVGYDGHQCFTDTGIVKVTVNPKPRVKLGPDLTLPTGSTQSLKAETPDTNIVSWRWSPPDNLSCTDCPTPTAEVKRNITYRATIQNEFGCIAADSMNIKTFCAGSQVFIPNAFTPDGDGLNDVMMVRAKGISVVRSFRIFSRWGQLVFEKTNFPPNDPLYGWDGKIKSITGPAEVYVYTAEVVCENDLINTYKGNITLLR